MKANVHVHIVVYLNTVSKPDAITALYISYVHLITVISATILLA